MESKRLAFGYILDTIMDETQKSLEKSNSHPITKGGSTTSRLSEKKDFAAMVAHHCEATTASCFARQLLTQ
jgi:hypothetical protein